MIRKAAIIGSGAMGASIAALMANAGLESVLLYDIVPKELTEHERTKNISETSPAFRDRIATQAIERLLKSRPAALFTKRTAEQIHPRNLEDHLKELGEVDIVVEAIVENLAVKQNLFRSVCEHVKTSAILATNTSGLSIDAICEGLPNAFRRRFLGMHFFNPPRQMRLVEIIPGKDTSNETSEEAICFCEDTLGKEIVIAKNTPAFIANRIGGNNITFAYQAFQEGYTVEEIDAATGRLMGRPVGSLQLADIIGLDVLSHDTQNTPEAYPWYFEMIEQGLVGNKAGAGFSKTIRGGQGKERFCYDLAEKAYRSYQPVKNELIDQAISIKDFQVRIKTLIDSDDRIAQLAVRLLMSYLAFAAEAGPEIADNVMAIDRAMCLGYNFVMGPFAMMDQLGIERVSEQIARLFGKVPALLAGKQVDRFYDEKGGYYSFASESYVQTVSKGLDLEIIKANGGLVGGNNAGSLIDLGDGILCLELHTPKQVITDGFPEVIELAVERAEAGFDGLVITSQAPNFCVGGDLANLKRCYEENCWEEYRVAVEKYQKAVTRLKYSSKPVVAAPKGKALGGGAELCLHVDCICADSELNIGLVEIGVGLIPSGGGTKEMLLRHIENIPKYYRGDRAVFFSKAFDSIFGAATSTCAADAREKGYLRDGDRWVMNHHNLLGTAKKMAINLSEMGYRPPHPPEIMTMGEHGCAVIKQNLFNMQTGDFISEYDRVLGGKLAHVLSSGDLPKNSVVNEAYILRQELECFMELAGMEKTQERIVAMLSTGKPLRN